MPSWRGILEPLHLRIVHLAAEIDHIGSLSEHDWVCDSVIGKSSAVFPRGKKRWYAQDDSCARFDALERACMGV